MKLHELHEPGYVSNLKYDEKAYATDSKKIDAKARELIAFIGKEDIKHLKYLETDQNYISQVLKLVKKYTAQHEPTAIMTHFLDTFTPSTISDIEKFEE